MGEKMKKLFDIFCEKCQQTYEVLCENEDLENLACKDCGNKVERVFSPIRSIWNCSGSHKSEYCKDGPKDRTPKSYYENKAKLEAAGKLEKIEGF
jgi:predicted nucleic acid-binding Zn ribbon protein